MRGEHPKHAHRSPSGVGAVDTDLGTGRLRAGARRRTSRSKFAVSLIAFASVGVLASCGDDDPPEAQPATDGTAFVGGAFEDLPLFRAATQIQRPTETDGVVAASYETETARPDQVIAFYRERLAELGWTEVAPPSEVGLDVWRGDWSKDGRLLEVSASPLSRNEGDATHTQFDLVLHEAG